MIYFFGKAVHLLEDFIVKYGVVLCFRAFLVVIILTMVLCHVFQIDGTTDYFVETEYFLNTDLDN